MSVIFVVLLLIAGLLFCIGWVILCVTIGADKISGQRREIDITGGMQYSVSELYDIGNPFCRYNGRTNW